MKIRKQKNGNLKILKNCEIKIKIRKKEKWKFENIEKQLKS